MSQHLDFPSSQPIYGQWMLLPHDVLPSTLARRPLREPMAPMSTGHAAAYLLALPAVMAVIAGVALVFAPLAS